jgi:drug/metabolite transporter (DMT)-like permease
MSHSERPTLMNFSQLGLAIIIMSSSGTLGRFITLPPPVVIGLRCAIGALALLIFIYFTRESLKVRKKSQRIVLISTILLGLHWVTYFYALQLSSVAIGMLALFTYPLFTALLEPVLLDKPFELRHFPLTVFALIGLYFLVPEFSINNNYTLGILIGLVSSITYSIRNILMKKNISSTSSSVMMFYQLTGIAIILVPTLLWFDLDFTHDIIVSNWQPLLILGLLTTAVSHTLFVGSFKHFSVTTVSILSNLTPLFGIGLGIWVLDEIPEGNIYIGGTIVLSLTFIESYFAVRKTKSD